MEYKNVKIVVFVPIENADDLRQVIGDNGAGQIGNYSHCSFSSVGYGRFKPNDNANPTIGENGNYEKVEEERIEFICPKEKTSEIIDVIKQYHPYEEVALDIYPLLEL